MSHVKQMNGTIHITPTPAENTKIRILHSPSELMKSGFTMPVLISTTSSIKSINPSTKIKSVTVTALFDTGASNTNIDAKLSKLLGLIPVGVVTLRTAAGPTQVARYAVDVSFPGSELKPFVNLPVSSCDLQLEIGDNGNILQSPKNFGMLIGRDLMTHWNIVWNGPTSTVFLSD